MENSGKAADEAGRRADRPRISDARIRNIFTHMVHGCVYCKITMDAKGIPAGYSVILVNEAMERIIGKASPANIRQNIKALLDETDLAVLARVALEGNSFVWEQYWAAPNRWYAVSAFGPEKYYVFLVIEDITERKLMERELEQGRKRYEALLKQSSDAIALVDAGSKKIIEVNWQLCRMTGYDEEELCGMDIYNLFDDAAQIEFCQAELAEKRNLPVSTRVVNCKGGWTVEVDRVVSLVNYNSQQLELITLYNISEERKLQQIIKEDAALASQVQRQMLPAGLANEIVEVKGLYKPLHMVSGDYFDYRLSKNKKALTGFLVDVAGHGLATALQTMAINVLLQDIIIREKMPTNKQLQLLNRRMAGYFNEGSFAALLIFHFDFAKKRLYCACCGINQFLAFSGRQRGWVKAKGSIMGAFDDPRFDFIEVPIQAGDCFYFLTDGISERLAAGQPIFDSLNDMVATTKLLDEITAVPAVRDDCSAVCVRICGANNYRYYFSGPEDAATLQDEIRRLLAGMAGDRALYLEIALNEAINNILVHGSGDGYFTMKKIGRRLVMRVRDQKQGFDARTVLNQYKVKPAAEIADEVSTQENGRGILIMNLFSDRVYCNRSGSEIMLVHKLA